MGFLLDLLSSGTWSLNLFSGSLGIVAYVLQALALYTIAKRRGLNKPWLAWVPLVNIWILGAISDQYQSVANGKTKKKRKILLGLCIAAIIVFFACLILFVVSLNNLDSLLPNMGPPMSDAEVIDPDFMDVISVLITFGAVFLALFFLCMIPALVLLIIIAVFRWMAIYDVFKSCEPKNARVYLLISLLLSFLAVSGLEAIFLFLCMNKDEGMIPKNPEPQPCIPEESAEQSEN